MIKVVSVIHRIYVAAASRDGKNQKELSVKVGDIIEVLLDKYLSSHAQLRQLYRLLVRYVLLTSRAQVCR